MTAAPRPAPAGAPAARALAIGIALPLVAGAAAVLGFAPFYFWPAPIAALAALFFAWERSVSPRQAALSGFVFGLGYFLVGVSWVFVSMHTYGGMPSVLAAFATFAFCAYLAGFPALAGWIAVRYSPSRRLALAVATMTLTEWIRGWLLTGFPWLGLGTSQVPASPLAGWAPYVGTYGVTLVACACAACLVALARRGERIAVRVRIAALLLALGVAGPLLSLVQWTAPAGPAVSVALLQGNVPQQLKWEESVRTKTMDAYRDMVYATKARIAILPEAALPAFLDQVPPEYLASLRRHAAETGQELLVGAPERSPPGYNGQDTRYYNSLFRIGADAKVPAYRKKHLVPFGEYVPLGFRWFVDAMRIPMGEFDRGARDQPPLVADGIAFGVAICYEDIFGEEVIQQLPAAQALVNVSNDAWFGESLAADQHLQASQMRALETGRWMVRSTNTGASAAIDPNGVVVSRLPPFVTATLVAEVVPRNGLTPYARWGNSAAVLLALLMLVGSRRRRG